MKIALLNEISQADKNQIIFSAMQEGIDTKQHQLFNYGMFSSKDSSELNYIHSGIIAAILLNSGAADFIITGCGTGMGAMISANSYPGVQCGFAADPLDGFLFMQINAGNAISLPFAKGFGWGAELHLKNIFEKMFSCPIGQGYPLERAAPQKKFRGILTDTQKHTYRNFLDILRDLDTKMLKTIVNSEGFKSNFFENCKDKEIGTLLKDFLV